MKKSLLYLAFALTAFSVKAQTCEELIQYVKSESYGTPYSSYTSDAISKVTFYNLQINYSTRYFAIVCFKPKYSYGCSEYIYQVGSNTQMYYSMNYLNGAGEAFWKYIQPYHENLDCSPDL